MKGGRQIDRQIDGQTDIQTEKEVVWMCVQPDDYIQSVVLLGSEPYTAHGDQNVYACV